MTCNELKNRGYPKGLKWYNFYTNVRLPICFVLSVLLVLGNLSQVMLIKSASYYYLAYQNEIGWIWLGIILEIVTFCLRISAYRRLRRFDYSSFSINTTLLVFECIVTAYSETLTKMSISTEVAVYAFLVTFSIFLFIWLLPNYAYFQKRRDLFSGLYSLIPSQEILDRLNEVADNPEAVKAIAKDMLSTNEINSNEYLYIIEHYIKNSEKENTIKPNTKSEQNPIRNDTVKSSERSAPVICCKYCGAKLIEGASFCNKCGQKTD